MLPLKRPEAVPLKRILFLPDAHTPFHEKRALRLILDRVVPAFSWYAINILGDWFDNWLVSSFSKDPKKVSNLRSLKRELAPGLALLRRFRETAAERYIFDTGNHEQRLPRMIGDKAPEAAEIVTDWWAEQMKGWEVIPYQEDTQIGKVNTTHDVGRAGLNSTRQSMEDYQDNMVMGHNHTMDFHVRGNARGIPHVGASFGWLGDVSKIDYRHRMKCRRDWVLGFGVGYMDERGVVFVNPKPIVNYTCEVEGRLFVG